MTQYQVKKKLTLNDYKLMENLEAFYYSRDYITPAEEAFLWHQQNPYTGVVLAEGENIVGFLDVLPVSFDTCCRILQGELNDRDLTAGDVLSPEQLTAKAYQPVCLFLSCAVIHPDYRQTKVMVCLLKAYKEQLDTMLENGVVFNQVVGDCVTPEGERFSRKMGLNLQGLTGHGTRVYRGTFQAFYDRLSALTESV